MRRPTKKRELYRWHTAAMHGDNPPIHEDEPHCGWFRTRLVRDGVPVPAVIWMEQPVDSSGALDGDEYLRCKIHNKEVDPYKAWTWLCKDPISEATYNYMRDLLAWAAEHAPDSPEANPHLSIQWGKVPAHSFGDDQ